MSEVRLIDEAALINEAETGGWDVDIKELKMILKYVPEINAAPVVRGEWEVAIGYDPNKKVQCQNCYKMAHEPTAYCPNCGARMEDT